MRKTYVVRRCEYGKCEYCFCFAASEPRDGIWKMMKRVGNDLDSVVDSCKVRACCFFKGTEEGHISVFDFKSVSCRILLVYRGLSLL